MVAYYYTINHTQYLFNYVDNVTAQLIRFKEKGVKNQLAFDIDCTKLPQQYSAKELRIAPVYKAIFHQLQDTNGPVLYWFDITSPTSREEIVAALKAYKISEKPRATPALRSARHHNTDVLYVGKVKKGFSNRLLQHLGYFNVSATQGLQLLYWTQELDLQLRLNVLEFADELADLMGLLEYATAKELQPLIGKHR